MKMAFISLIDSVNKDHVALVAGSMAPATAAPLVRLSSSMQVNAEEISLEETRSEETRAKSKLWRVGYDNDDGNGGATGRGRNAPGKIFAPGGKLVSERLRSMTEDERVRTVKRERDSGKG